jgi:hypothetical protein
MNRIIRIICVSLCCALLMTVIMTGCGAGTGDAGAMAEGATVAGRETGSEGISGTERPDGEDGALPDDGTLTVRVTGINGGTVTAAAGEITQPEMEAPPDMPEGAQGGVEGPSGEMGPPADGGEQGGDTAEDGGGAPWDGENGQPPAMQGDINGGVGGFIENGGDITFYITDETAVTMESLEGSREASIDDIAEGSVLEITLDSENNATGVVIKTPAAGGDFGGSGEAADGAPADTIG